MGKKRSTKSTGKKAPASKTDPQENGWELIGNVWDEMFTFENPGDEFIGVYISTGHDIGPNASQVHIFAKGPHRIGLWGSSALDQRMKTAKPGYMTKVRFDSLALATKSGREYKDFQVWQQNQPAPGYSEAPQEDIPF